MADLNVSRRRRLALVAATLPALLSPASASAARAPEPVEGRYVVVYRPTVDGPSEKTARLERANGFRSRFRYASAQRGSPSSSS